MNFNPMSLFCVHYVGGRPKQQHIIIIIIIVKSSMWESLLFVHFSFFQRNHKMVIVWRTYCSHIYTVGKHPLAAVVCTFGAVLLIITVLYLYHHNYFYYFYYGQSVSAFHLGNCFPAARLNVESGGQQYGSHKVAYPHCKQNFIFHLHAILLSILSCFQINLYTYIYTCVAVFFVWKSF